ncbi:dihydroflavonol-4-reductase [Furfurilactobacillus siliginis]|uniref:Dihydroflavonol-4-reductase n=2 Tax=Furfurilactobacillus siliginis TaxID=348151 RepID=A0A0R2KWZ8_9LACO|nr:NAD-dependent epimerase/dehydratase family protein [Furfurilactobacillus siliginis]KRN93977.1 dihydroflavonol-4-reductase [Furfurilactobacillus siliginis]
MKHENEIALISGITGYMATWVAKKLLEEGYRVRGTYRSEKRLPYIKKILPGVELVQTDLNSDAGWDDAFKDVTAFFHVASPQAVATEHDRTGTAMKGVDNVFAAAFRASSLRKIVLTSSEAAVAYGKQNKTMYGRLQI